jgi:hypothetical protein
LGKVFPWKMGLWRDPLIIKSIFIFNNNWGKCFFKKLDL